VGSPFKAGIPTCRRQYINAPDKSQLFFPALADMPSIPDILAIRFLYNIGLLG
jgi:hypothetical protein